MNVILNELLDENLVKRINAYINKRDDDEKFTLDAKVTINVPVRLPVYKDGDYSGSNLYEDCLDCASDYLEGGVSLRRITAGILIHAIEVEKLPAEEIEPLASPAATTGYLNLNGMQWGALSDDVQRTLRVSVYQYLNQEVNKN